MPVSLDQLLDWLQYLQSSGQPPVFTLSSVHFCTWPGSWHSRWTDAALKTRSRSGVLYSSLTSSRVQSFLNSTVEEDSGRSGRDGAASSDGNGIGSAKLLLLLFLLLDRDDDDDAMPGIHHDPEADASALAIPPTLVAATLTIGITSLKARSLSPKTLSGLALLFTPAPRESPLPPESGNFNFS